MFVKRMIMATDEDGKKTMELLDYGYKGKAVIK
jgi:hypothetical protein